MSNREKSTINDIISNILQIRCLNNEEKKNLCLELLSLATEKQDGYALAFSHTYLGEYYLSQHDCENAGSHLFAAKKMLSDGLNAPEIALQHFSLLAIFYNLSADEQSSMQCYMDALDEARRLQDVTAECEMLNNIALAFRRHKAFPEALKYFKDAYKLIPKVTSSIVATILSNLGGLLTELDRLEEAKKHFEECDTALAQNNSIYYDEYKIRNWCLYYATLKDSETALYWADKAVKKTDLFLMNRFTAFENFNILFYSMLKIKNKDYAVRFLKLMKQCVDNSSLEQQLIAEECNMKFSLQFEPNASHMDAYRSFFNKTIQIKKQANLAISNTMKSKISLNNAIVQKEQLQAEQSILEIESRIDELTGIYSRRFLNKLLLERANEMIGGSLGIVMLDVDYFKEYNDYYGHLMGDTVLSTVASILSEVRIDGIYPCRYGGDEFACVCDGLSPQDVEDYILRIREALQEKAIPHQKSLCCEVVTLSIGYAAESQDSGLNSYMLSQRADQALYASKLSGRNSFTRDRESVNET